jgi:hypothetical protein
MINSSMSKKKGVLSGFTHVLRSVYTNKLQFIAMIVSDIIMVWLLLGWFYFPIIAKIQETLNASGSLLLSNVGESGGLQLLSTPALRQNALLLVVFFVALIVSIYLVYSTFTGISWLIGNRVMKLKNKTFWKIFKINLIWLSLLIALRIVYFAVRFAFRIAKANTAAIITDGIAFVLTILLLYLSFVSYQFLANKKITKAFTSTFRLGLVKHSILIITIALMWVITTLLLMLVNFVFSQIPKVSIVIDVVILFVAVEILRLFMIHIIDVWSKK